MRLIRKITSFVITKRERFVLMSGFLTVVLIATQTVPPNLRPETIGFLAISTIFLAMFALWGELHGIKYFLLLLMPVYFVVGASLFYFLLPVRWLTRLPFAFLFGISVYLLMLTANIYNVAAIRTIALHRAARAVAMLFALVSTFFLTNVLLSFHLPFFIEVPGVLLIVAPLYLAQMWSNELEEYVSKKLLVYSAVFTLLTVQVATAFSFWPLPPINGALILITVMYLLLGVGQFAFNGQLKPKNVWEYLSVALLVLVVVVVTTRWGG